MFARLLDPEFSLLLDLSGSSLGIRNELVLNAEGIPQLEL